MSIRAFPLVVRFRPQGHKKIPLHSIENGAGGFFVARHFRLASRSLLPETLSIDGGILGVALDEIAARLHIVAH